MGDREREHGALDPTDLAIVVSHFNLGVIRAMVAVSRGAPGGVKYEVDSDRGRFLLKRRRESRDHLDRVTFVHAVEIALVEAGFPIPRLIGTARHHSSMVIHGGSVFELHEWVTGSRYDDSVSKTVGSGSALARLHETFRRTAIAASVPRFPTRAERANHVLGHLDEIRKTGSVHAAPAIRAYTDAVRQIETLGVSRWDESTIHGDWHPGNLVFEGDRVSAVLDFDNARPGHRTSDIATGVLQFSMIGGKSDPRTWPEHADLARVEAFLTGYDSVVADRLTKAELEGIPPLMIEALIGEAAGPIATTGRFAAIEGGAFLEMVVRKARWVAANAKQISGSVG